MTTAELGPAATPERLAELARKRAKYVLARRVMMVALALCIAASVVSLTYVVVQTRTTAQQVKACTTPGSPCYDALARQSADARAALLRDIQAAVDESGASSDDNLVLTQQNRATLVDIQQRLEQAGCLPVPQNRK